MKFSEKQQQAISSVSQWLKEYNSGDHSRPFFYLAGYAGAGKSTLAKHLADLQNGNVVYGAFTGKAAKVMRDNGCYGASTIHAMIYKTTRDEETGKFSFHWDHEAEASYSSLIVIDECSMVAEDLAKGLLNHKVPILALGDPGQLPPVKGGGYFTSKDPNFMLDEIHRQAKDSPILRIATEIRLGKFKRDEEDVAGLKIIRRCDISLVESACEVDATIVGRNLTRTRFNNAMRKKFGFLDSSYPYEGETLICLRNDKDLGIHNGEIWTVMKSTLDERSRFINLELSNKDDPDKKIMSTVHSSFFDGGKRPSWKGLIDTQEFDYGYVLTAHKSQGSQWDKVIVLDESSVFRGDANRWLYTAVTRASKELTLVV